MKETTTPLDPTQGRRGRPRGPRRTPDKLKSEMARARLTVRQKEMWDSVGGAEWLCRTLDDLARIADTFPKD